MRQTPQTSFSRNRLLAVIATDDFERLRPNLERVTLDAKLSLEMPNVPIAYVYFPEPCVGSIVAVTARGEKLEVGLFGPEGMSGLAIVNGTDRSPHETFIQVPGFGYRIKADHLSKALDASPPLQRLLNRYGQAAAIQVAYTALANGRYTIEERLARWLLMCHDRVDGDTIMLTHEFLALMLGVRRAGVTTALNALEVAKIIKATRGRIEILDRQELLESAADSYGTPEAEYERLLGPLQESGLNAAPQKTVA